MNGLFTRLAAQASGRRAATLHSPASLPYRGAPEQPSLDYPPTSLPETQRASVEQPAAPFAPSHEPVLGQPLASADSETNTRDVIRTWPSSAKVSTPESPADIVLPEPFAPLQQPDTGEPHARSIPSTIPAQLTPTMESRAERKDAARFGQEMSGPERHAQSDMASVAGTDSLQTNLTAHDANRALSLPTALLSPGTVPVRQAAAPAVPSAAKTPPRQADEVHIHIGRIEVTAIQESAPSKRETRKGPAPLSLDDYLAKRKGDGR